VTQRRAHKLTHAHTVTLCLLRTHASTHKNAQATLSRSLTHSLVQRFHLLESKALQILSTLTQLSVPDSTIASEPRPPENSEFSLPLHSHVTPASPLASHRRGLDRSRYRRTRPFTSSHLRWHHPPTAPTSFDDEWFLMGKRPSVPEHENVFGRFVTSSIILHCHVLYCWRFSVLGRPDFFSPVGPGLKLELVRVLHWQVPSLKEESLRSRRSNLKGAGPGDPP